MRRSADGQFGIKGRHARQKSVFFNLFPHGHKLTAKRVPGIKTPKPADFISKMDIFFITAGNLYPVQEDKKPFTV